MEIVNLHTAACGEVVERVRATTPQGIVGSFRVSGFQERPGKHLCGRDIAGLMDLFCLQD